MQRRCFLTLLLLTCMGLVSKASSIHAVETEVPLPGTKIILDLSNAKGRIVHADDFRGRWLMVFFGYTSCPDICPTTLSDVAQVLRQLGPSARKVQPIFVTVDPDRDTPDRLRSYVDNFDPRILPLWGKPRQLSEAAKSFGVSYFKIPGPTQKDYTMAHSAFISLVGPEGGIVTRFSATDNEDQIASQLTRLMA
jgi:protein SCO1/2